MARKHTHKYYHGRRVAGTLIWSCALPECGHYMPKHMEELIEGRLSICWKCNEPFVMMNSHMKMEKPICDNCQLITSNLPNSLPSPIQVTPIPAQNMNESEVGVGLCMRCKKIPAETNQNTLCHQCFLEADFNEIRTYLNQKGLNQ